MDINVQFITRSNAGIEVSTVTHSGKYEVISKNICAEKCLCMALSVDGKYLAYSTRDAVLVVNCDTFDVKFDVPQTGITDISFSPTGAYLLYWKLASYSDVEPNVHVLNFVTGMSVTSFIHKEAITKESFQWTANDEILVRIYKGKLIWYNFELSQFNETTLELPKTKSFSVSPKERPALDVLMLAHFPADDHTTASTVKMIQVDRSNHFENVDLCSKSFFQGDYMNYYWNSKGDMALVVNNTESDKTGASYYGRKMLYLFSKGEACQITLSKDGPIHHVNWLPNENQFLVISGNMPADINVYNQKAELLYQLCSGVFNSSYFNSFGNLLILGGFGNLPGYVQTMDIEQKLSLATFKSSYTTFLQICPDGMHFLTATTYPHFKIDNGYKIWHYSGNLCYEFEVKSDFVLYDIAFRPKNEYKKPEFNEKALVVGAIVPKKPETSSNAYVPPHLRNVPPHLRNKVTLTTEVKKGKTRTRKKKSEKVNESKHGQSGSGQSSVDDKNDAKTKGKSVVLKQIKIKSTVNVAVTSLIEDKLKKLRNLNKKLEAINKLKESQNQGCELNADQLKKIQTEKNVIDEIALLSIQCGDK